jgi:hypothetical protein
LVIKPILSLLTRASCLSLYFFFHQPIVRLFLILDNQVFGVAQTVEAGGTPYLRPRKKASLPLYEHSVKKLDYRVIKHTLASKKTFLGLPEKATVNAQKKDRSSPYHA